jgi:D-alanyl-D-alanine carboxypeptidase
LDKWLRAALDYIPSWIEHQMRLGEQPGCSLAIAHKGKVVLEAAFGHADISRNIPMTPRHRFRVASHSKCFTAAGVLKLREQGHLALDEPVGRHLKQLHPQVARATLQQLLTHSAGLVRDGSDSGQWSDRRPFLDEAQVRADLANGPTLPPNTRFKYSNHGYALLGLVIEAITGERYGDWIAREIVAAAKLHETTPDAPFPRGAALASGHSARLPLGRRVIIPGDMPTHALAPATGFVSTAHDLALYFAGLSPQAKRSVLSVDSRREMLRRQWRDPHASAERWYGLGTIIGTLADWELSGHTGGFQGTVSRSVTVPAHDIAVSVLTNANDGQAYNWVDGMLHILRAYALRGAPTRRLAGWDGRWWSLWGAVDLLAMGDRVMVTNPSQPNPLLDASEVEVARRNGDGTWLGHITLANGYALHGEPVRMLHDARGRATEFWLAGHQLLPETRVAKELERKYGSARRRSKG